MRLLALGTPATNKSARSRRLQEPNETQARSPSTAFICTYCAQQRPFYRMEIIDARERCV